MLEAMDFYYDGIYSVDMGLFNCKIDTGFYDEQFIANRDIQEINIKGRDRPYFQQVKRSPLEFSLTFAFEEHYDEALIRRVARWLDQDYYKPFYTTSNPERIFYCMLYSESNLLHNGLKEGYVNIKMRCDSPYTYSPVYTSPEYQWNETPVTFNEDTFEQGNLDNLITNSNGDLTIDPNKNKWINLSPSLTWNDI